MDEQKRRKIKNRITMFSILMLVVIVGYIVYILVFNQLNIMVFKMILTAFLIIYFILLDIIEPILLKQFNNITEVQKSSYFKFLGLDMIGTGCLIFFVISMGTESSEGTGNSLGIYLVLVYFVTARFKNKFKNVFLKIETENKKELQEKIQENTDKINEDTDKIEENTDIIEENTGETEENNPEKEKEDETKI